MTSKQYKIAKPRAKDAGVAYPSRVYYMFFLICLNSGLEVSSLGAILLLFPKRRILDVLA